MYYLYRHIRLDKNEPFYIGIGTVSKEKLYSKELKSFYKRAYQYSKRNSIWKNVANKSEYEVEILLESDDYDFIKRKEIEFIKLYGRIDLRTGILANLTNGGDHNSGRTLSNKHREKISLSNKGKKRTSEQRAAQSARMKGTTVSPEARMKISNKNKGRKPTKEHIDKIISANSGRVVDKSVREKISNTLTGYKQSEYTKLKRAEAIQKPVIQRCLDGFIISRYNSVAAVIEINPLYKVGSVRKCCQGILKTYKKFIWEYK